MIAAELKIVIDTDAASALFGERFPSFWQSYVINDFQGIQIASSDSKGRIVKPDFFVQALGYMLQYAKKEGENKNYVYEMVYEHAMKLKNDDLIATARQFIKNFDYSQYNTLLNLAQKHKDRELLYRAGEQMKLEGIRLMQESQRENCFLENENLEEQRGNVEAAARDRLYLERHKLGRKFHDNYTKAWKSSHNKRVVEKRHGSGITISAIPDKTTFKRHNLDDHKGMLNALKVYTGKSGQELIWFEKLAYNTLNAIFNWIFYDEQFRK